MLSAPTFYVVPGSTVKRVIDDNKKQVFDAVEAAYRLHGSGNTLNPDSYFLRYPDRPSARIIALPAHLGGAVVIRMPSLPIRQDHDARPELAYLHRQGHAGGNGVLEARIGEASAYVPLERLALSPQCGFASGEYAATMTHAEQEAKLRLVGQVAAKVWPNG